MSRGESPKMFLEFVKQEDAKSVCRLKPAEATSRGPPIGLAFTGRL